MQILFSDPEIAVCIKPVGMDSEHEVPQALTQQLGGEIFTLHRLDKNVGGVMVYARTKQAAALLSEAVRSGDMIKEYVAFVHGQPPECGDWQDYLFKDSRKNKVFVVKRERKGVKFARLEFTRIKAQLVRVRLHTGRTHQIRVQFASRGFPLFGDRKYGAKDEYPAPMLYCCCITFPYQGQTVQFTHLPDWAQ